MKNVVIFIVGSTRFGVELRWVGEVLTLGWITRVPGAPPSVLGALNHRGTIVPLIDVLPVFSPDERAQVGAAHGQMGILLDVDTVRVCLLAQRIDEVTTLETRDRGWVNARGDVVKLLDPPLVLRRVKRQVEEAAAREDRSSVA